MKDFRKKNSVVYFSMLVCSVVLGIALLLTSLLVGKIPISAIPGFILVLAVTLSMYRSQLYVSLTSDSIIIKNATQFNKDVSYHIPDIDIVRIEHSFINGYSIGIKRGYTTDVYKLSLVGKQQIALLKSELSARGIKIS